MGLGGDFAAAQLVRNAGRSYGELRCGNGYRGADAVAGGAGDAARLGTGNSSRVKKQEIKLLVPRQKTEVARRNGETPNRDSENRRQIHSPKFKALRRCTCYRIAEQSQSGKPEGSDAKETRLSLIDTSLAPNLPYSSPKNDGQGPSHGSVFSGRHFSRVTPPILHGA